MNEEDVQMKKLVALLLAAMMLFAVSAVSMAEEAGFDEYELGVEGEQDVDFMTMAMVYFQPVDMAPAENATPKEGSDLHIEVDLTAKENPYGFPVDGWVPYLSIDFVIKDKDGNCPSRARQRTAICSTWIRRPALKPRTASGPNR